ncbi:hypothetical protein ACE103_08650 [Bradyrhizobium sp. ma5]|uniref:hypothetical protein n=1 Tax=Bradyrhizobium sp. ma5 TaxID=3344828 RepID=UPI0035D5096C
MMELFAIAERLGLPLVQIYLDALGTLSGGPLSRPEETHQEIEGRKKEMKTVRNAIWRRRFAYFATVSSSAILALLPVFDGIRGLSFWQSIIGARTSWLLSPVIDGIRDLSFWQSIIGTWTSWLLSMLSPDHWLAPVLNLAVKERFGPGWAAPWLTSFANHPTLFLLSATLLLWLFLRKSQLLQTRIFHLAQYAWRHA